MDRLDGLRGRVNDADSHEMIPAKLWPECFGDAGEVMADLLKAVCESSEVSGQLEDFLADTDSDETEITYDSVWRRSGWGGAGCLAPGAIDMGRRVEVLDFMGVNRQTVFPTFGLWGMVLSCASPEMLSSLFAVELDTVDPTMFPPMGQMICSAYNNWVMEATKVGSERLRFTAVIDTSDFDVLMSEAERVLDAGVTSLFIPASVPPGGKSPADRDLAPFWSLCEEANASVLLHIALENFLLTDAWRRAPEFAMETQSSEFLIDPWSFATSHWVVENYVLTMVLGGVFERHPDLRFGVIECGAQWVGPLGDNLDKWAKVFKRRMSNILTMPPSEYINRNVRVTPYIFEDTAKNITRYGLEDVYVYGSDYPHIEGGIDQLETYYKNLESLGPTMVEKFFVTNPELILPPLAANVV